MARRAAELTDDLNETVLALRDYYGLSTVQLAELTGIQRSTLFNRITGAIPWTPAELRTVAAAFGVPVGMLSMPRRDTIRWLLDHPEKEESSRARRFRYRAKAAVGMSAKSRCFWHQPSVEMVSGSAA